MDRPPRLAGPAPHAGLGGARRESHHQARAGLGMAAGVRGARVRVPPAVYQHDSAEQRVKRPAADYGLRVLRDDV